jgi:hypothetical protein
MKQQSHERMTHVYGFLADFAAAYPRLSEGEQAMYRDLCRAALVTLDDEQKAESMLLGRSVDEFLFRACRQDVGTWLLNRLREVGVNVRLVRVGKNLRLRAEPPEKRTPAVVEKIRQHRQALRDALVQDGLSDPAILKMEQRA